MRASREQKPCRTLVSGLLALAAACVSSRSGQREAPVPDPVSIPVAEATLAPAPERPPPPAHPPADPPPVDPVQRLLARATAALGNRAGRAGTDRSHLVPAAFTAAGA